MRRLQWNDKMSASSDPQAFPSISGEILAGKHFVSTGNIVLLSPQDASFFPSPVTAVRNFFAGIVGFALL